jgi:hypothetical protein
MVSSTIRINPYLSAQFSQLLQIWRLEDWIRGKFREERLNFPSLIFLGFQIRLELQEVCSVSISKGLASGTIIFKYMNRGMECEAEKDSGIIVLA